MRHATVPLHVGANLLMVIFMDQFVERPVAVEEAVERGPEQVVAEKGEQAGDHGVGERQLSEAAPDNLVGRSDCLQSHALEYEISEGTKGWG